MHKINIVNIRLNSFVCGFIPLLVSIQVIFLSTRVFPEEKLELIYNTNSALIRLESPLPDRVYQLQFNYRLGYDQWFDSGQQFYSDGEKGLSFYDDDLSSPMKFYRVKSDASPEAAIENANEIFRTNVVRILNDIASTFNTDIDAENFASVVGTPNSANGDGAIVINTPIKNSGSLTLQEIENGADLLFIFLGIQENPVIKPGFYIIRFYKGPSSQLWKAQLKDKNGRVLLETDADLEGGDANALQKPIATVRVIIRICCPPSVTIEPDWHSGDFSFKTSFDLGDLTSGEFQLSGQEYELFNLGKNFYNESIDALANYAKLTKADAARGIEKKDIRRVAIGTRDDMLGVWTHFPGVSPILYPHFQLPCLHLFYGYSRVGPRMAGDGQDNMGSFGWVTLSGTMEEPIATYYGGDIEDEPLMSERAEISILSQNTPEFEPILSLTLNTNSITPELILPNAYGFPTLIKLNPSIIVFPFKKCVTPPANMIAWWTFDDPINSTIFIDIIGGNNAISYPTPIGTPQGPQSLIGKVSNAAKFYKSTTVTNGAIVYPTNQLTSLTNFTIDAWVKVPDIQENTNYYILRMIGNRDIKFFVKRDSNFAATNYVIIHPIPYAPMSAPYYWNTTPIITPNTWHHFAFVFSNTNHPGGSIIKIYIDGTLATPYPFWWASPQIIPTINQIYIGWGGPTEPGGTIILDELEIFNRTLTDNEIAKIYNAGKYGKCKPAKGKVCITKFEDTNGNGIKEPNETTLDGWLFNIYDVNSNLIKTITTCGGMACFSLTPGYYIVTEQLQSGWAVTTPLSGSYNVYISPGQTTNLFFGNKKQVGKAEVCIWKFRDVNTNRIYDTYDVLLPNWQFNVVSNGTIIKTITNKEGVICFSLIAPGTYQISEVMQSGWTNTTPNPVSITLQPNQSTNVYFGNIKVTPTNNTGQICIYKYNDLNNNRTYDGNEPLLNNWVFNVYSNTPAGSLQIMTITNYEGVVCFTLPAPGTYQISEVIQPGWTNTTPNPTSITLQPGQVTNIYFGNVQVKPPTGTAEICLIKYEDVNTNGVFDGSGIDYLIPGWQFNVLSNGVIIKTVTNDVEGVCFALPAPGTYQISEVMQPGWTNITANPINITVQPGQVTNIMFGNIRVKPSTGYGEVCIYKFNDINGNGVYDTNEVLLTNWVFNVISNTPIGDMIIQTVTNYNGVRCIGLPAPGTYQVSEVMQLGWTNTTPNPTSITLQPGQVTNIYFGNIQTKTNLLLSLCGYKWNDLNANGIWDTNEPALSGWSIILTNGNNVLQTFTDQNGQYCFSNLTQGVYIVSEIQQQGWIQTFPKTNYVIQLVNSLNNINFGNFNFGCFNAPSNMVAWFPLDDPTGQVTVVDMVMNNNGSTKDTTSTVLPINSVSGTSVIKQLPDPGIYGGSLTPVVTDPATTPPRGALFFSQGYIEVPHNPNYNITTNGFTITLWAHSPPANYIQPLIEKYDFNANNGYSLYLTNSGGNYTVVFVLNGLVLYGPSFPPSASANDWHFIFVRAKPSAGEVILGSADLYGSISLTTNAFSPMFPMTTINTKSLTIAANAYVTGTNFIYGSRLSLDEIEIFNRGLKENELSDIYNYEKIGARKCACVSPPQNMVAWYSMDYLVNGTFLPDIAQPPGSAVNDTATCSQGAAGPNCPTPVPGMVGGAFYFTGSYFIVPDSTDLNLTNDLTIDAWIKVVGCGPGRLAPIFDKYDNTNSIGIALYVNQSPSNAFLEIIINGNTANSTTFNYGSWVHIAVTLNHALNQGTFYINGATAGSFVLPSGSYGNALPLLIGGLRLPATYCEIAIDELEIFNRSLSINEIRSIFTAGSAGKCKNK